MATHTGSRPSHTRQHWRLLAALWSLLLHLPAAAAEPLHFGGRAFDLDSGRIVYTEEHSFTSANLYRVIYREPDGEAFASKTADFSSARFAPDVEQHNARNGEVIRITRKNADTLSATYRAARDQPTATREIAAGADTVIDAGFHPYILARWEALLGGRVKRIDYVVPTWQRSVALAIAAAPCADAGRQCFTIKPANALIAVFAEPVELVYDTHSRRLLEFRGTSNIARHSGDYHRVRIVYDYPPAAPALADRSAGAR